MIINSKEMQANYMSADAFDEKADSDSQEKLPKHLSHENANDLTQPLDKSPSNTDNSNSIDAPVMRLQLSLEKSGEKIRLARLSHAVDENDDVPEYDDDDDDHHVQRSSPQAADFAKPAIEGAQDLFMTLDKGVREFDVQHGTGLYNQLHGGQAAEDLSSQGFQSSTAAMINQQMQQVPLDTQGPTHSIGLCSSQAIQIQIGPQARPYKSSAVENPPSSDNNNLAGVSPSQARSKPSIESLSSKPVHMHTEMNFEKSQRDIFESSGFVNINPQAQPQEYPSIDLRSNLNLLQTLPSSSGQSTAPALKSAQELHKEQQKMSFCSLFVIFGLNATEFVHKNFKEQYDVLGSYPNLEQHPEVAAEHKFVQDLRMICFPELSLRTERFKITNQDLLCRCSFYHFISTNDLGDKKYLTSVHFKEMLLSEKGAFVFDKAICVASSQPIFSLQKQVLQQIFQKVVLHNNNVSIKAFKEAKLTYDGFLDEYDQPMTNDFPNFVYKFMMDQIMCAENRKIRDRSSPSRSPSHRDKAAAANGSALQLPTVDFTSVLELYISIFSKHLYYDPKVERDIHIIQTCAGPATSVYNSSQSLFGTASNFATNSTQQQQHDQRTNAQKTNRHIPLFKFRNMKPFGFQLENYPFDLMLQTIKPDKLIQLVTALLLERKIVLIKRDIGDIALIMQSLITLLSPFQWHFTIITYLTRELVDMLDAPFPFMIGVSSATWESICLTKDYAEEIFIFDLELQERWYIKRQVLPDLPSPQGEDLLAGLKDVIDKKDRRLAALRAENKQSKSKSLSKWQLDQQFDEQYWADAQLSVKQLFFNFLLMTVNNYISYYRTEDELNKNKDSGAAAFDGKSPEDFFDFQGYLESQDKRQMERTGQSNLFMHEFVNTQCFHQFIEQNWGNCENEGAENAAVFFESCIELLNDHSMKKLKAAQQEMIDQAKYNLATPVKFKLNGIISKYVDGLRSREVHLRNCLEKIQDEESKEQKFADLSEADQIDDIIMKYIFMRPQTPGQFRQYSLIADVNPDMVFERIPKIRYDLVELYWQKMYKTKQVGPGGKQSTRSIENSAQANNPVNKQPHNDNDGQKLKKRLSNKGEIAYDEFLKGNQAMQIDRVSETSSQKSNTNLFKFSSQLKKNKSGNIIHDYPEQTGSKNQITIAHNHPDTMDLVGGTEIKAKKLERQALSTRNFASLSVQKGPQLRNSYNVKSYHHYTTNKAQNEQLRISGKGKKSTESFQEAFAASQNQYLRQTKSPKVSTTLAKSTTMSITRTAATNTLLQSTKHGLLQSYRKNSKASPSNLAVMSAIKSARNKSQQQSQQLQLKQNPSKSGASTTAGAKQNAVNFQEKIRVARQRGSIQYTMLEAANAQNTASMQHLQQQYEVIDKHELVNGDDHQSVTQRQNQLPDFKYKLTTHVSARHISPHHPQPNESTTPIASSHKSLTKGGKLTSSVQSLNRPVVSNRDRVVNAENSANKPIDRQQSFLVKGKHGSMVAVPDKGKTATTDQNRKVKSGVQTPNHGSGTQRQQKSQHPAINASANSQNQQRAYLGAGAANSGGGYSLDQIIPGRKSLKNKPQMKDRAGEPSIELLDPSSSSAADKSNSNIMMPEYTEKKAVTNKNAQKHTMTQLVQSIQAQSNQLNQTNNATRNNSNNAVGSLSKVLRISYELPQSKNSFINIEKEESCVDDDNTIQHTQEMSMMTKDADRTELQDFTKPLAGMLAQQEIQGGGKPRQPNQADSLGSQGGGAMMEIEPPLIVSSAEEEADEDRKDEIIVYNSTTESFRGEGVNEMVEDEAHNAQKTAYYLQYRSKFNKINSESSIKLHHNNIMLKNVGQPIRNQMMPSNTSNSYSSNSNLKQSSTAAGIQLVNSKVVSGSVVSNVRASDNSGASSTPSHNQLVMQMSGSSSDNKLSNLLQGKTITGQNLSSEKQKARKGPSMPLSMLLTKTNSRPAKRPAGASKTRSITDKQFSFQEISRLPSHSLVAQSSQKMTSKQQKMKSGNDLEAPAPVFGLMQKQSQQEEMSIPIPRSSADTVNNHFHQAAAGGELDDDLGDDGWFTPIESKRLSLANVNEPLVSDETKQKLQRFYSDIDGSFMDVSSHLNRDQNQQQIAAALANVPQTTFSQSAQSHQFAAQQPGQSSGSSRVQQPSIRKPSKMHPPQQNIDSPQQSSRQSSGLGQHPISSISRTTQIENKVLSNQEVALMSPGQDNQITQGSQSQVDDSIAAPNKGILFSHQKRRNEKYRDDL